MQLRSSFLLLALAAAACGYSAPDEVINGQAVAAIQKNNTTWANYQTFSVANKVQVFDNRSGNGQADQGQLQNAPALIDQVRQNMTRLGWTEVPFNPALLPPAPGAADVVLGLVAYLGSTTYGGYYCDWYYYGYYPYGCGYYYYGTYNFGTLQIQMGDFKNAVANPPPNSQAQLQIIWNATMYGITSNQQYNLAIAQSAIDRAFDQSPYLHK
ncbi:MAG TPA: DUF4136 domain-containing protein [Anaeromyxobacteraceae bacterium]|nr:DUF4136 domain-containing protein [Anaeromyxobacteraceae bacterium]